MTKELWKHINYVKILEENPDNWHLEGVKSCHVFWQTSLKMAVI